MEKLKSKNSAGTKLRNFKLLESAFKQFNIHLPRKQLSSIMCEERGEGIVSPLCSVAALHT